MRFIFAILLGLQAQLAMPAEDISELKMQLLQFQVSEVTNWKGLIDKLANKGKTDGQNPVLKRILSHSKPGFEERILQLYRKNEISREEQQYVIDNLNFIASAKLFFDPEVFNPEVLPVDARTLIKKGVAKLDTDETIKLNHILIEAYFTAELVQKFTNSSERRVAHAAESLLKKGNPRAALELCVSGLKEDPNNWYTLLSKARALIDLGEYIEAEKELAQLMKRNPNHEAPYFEMARVLLLRVPKEGETDALLEWLQSGNSVKQRAAITVVRESLTRLRSGSIGKVEKVE